MTRASHKSHMSYMSYMSYSACLAALLLLAIPACAWGPHTQVTQAALDAIDAQDPIVKHLGPSFEELPAYSWMGDYNRSIRKDTDGGLYYADDYLLFPAMQKHTNHVMPGVRESLKPYFQRSVQALRTETPTNAARWVGTLLHFTEDAGAPPHAYPDVGNLHHKMENWIDSDRIGIGGYEPQFLGTTEDEALVAYLKRMDALIAFSIERAKKIIPLAKVDDRAAVEPLELECANECSRVVADLLHTLGQIALSPVPDSASIGGTIKTKPDAPMDGRLAKIVISGTNYSTVADPSGKWQLHNLPAGTYMGKVHYPGCRMDNFTARLEPGQSRTINILMVTLKPVGNLLRNPDLRVQWKSPGAPDSWFVTKTGWESDVVPVTAGQKYELSVRWKHGVTGSASVRWYTNLSPGIAESKDEQPVEKPSIFTAPEKMESACVIINTDRPIADVCEAISFSAVK